MTAHEWILIVVLVAMIVALFSRRFSPAASVVGAVIALYLFQASDFETAFSGFANPAPMTIAALYIVAAGVDRTGALQWMLRPIIASPNLRVGLWRITVPTALLSAFVANTPVVAMVMGPITSWAKSHSIAPSRVLLPLSYATIIGGTLTAIGTSTTVVASGVLVDAGSSPLGFWEPTHVTLPYIIVGLVMVATLPPYLLPDRSDPDSASDGSAETDADAHERDEPVSLQPYVVSLVVDPDGPLDGTSIADGGLRSLHQAYVVGVERDRNLIAPVSPELVLRAGDVVNIAGRVDEMLGVDRLSGLKLREARQLWALDDNQHAWFEAVVGAASPLVGRTIKQVGFRERYQAAVVGIRQSGTDVTSELGDARLQVGDSLLMVADLGFGDRWHHQRDFLIVQQHDAPPPTASARAPIAIVILIAMVAFTVSGVVNITEASIWAAAATVISGILTPRQAREAVNLDVIIMIACAIGIGRVAAVTGLDQRVADSLSDLFAPVGVAGIAFGVVVATMVLTELVSNAGAVAVMVPIALSTAADAGGDPRRFVLGVVLAASSSFLTPIGYQTNTMVFGPGRYHPSDYVRFGLPFTIAAAAFATAYMANLF